MITKVNLSKGSYDQVCFFICEENDIIKVSNDA